MAQLDLLLIGKTGHGKSATGNSILGRSAFKTSASSTSVTEDVERSDGEFGDHKIKVVDGPGVTDTSTMGGVERQSEQMVKTLALCGGGVDAFVFVVRFGSRFTQKELSCLDSLKKIFGSHFMKHMIVVMTGGDYFENFMEDEGSNFTFGEWCRQQNGTFRELLKECEGRCVLFNNRERDERKRRDQVKRLLEIVVYLTKKYGRYVSHNFTAAKEMRHRLIREFSKSVLKESIQTRCSLLAADIDNLPKDPSDRARKQIKQRLQDLKEDIENGDEENDLNDDVKQLVEKSKQNLNEMPKLVMLSRELENIQETKKLFSLMGAGVTVAGGAVGLLVPFIGAVLAATGAISTLAGRMQIDSKEKELQSSRDKIIEQRKKPSVFPDNKELEFQRKTKDD